MDLRNALHRRVKHDSSFQATNIEWPFLVYHDLSAVIFLAEGPQFYSIDENTNPFVLFV